MTTTPKTLFKKLFYPGFNLGTRSRKKLCRLFLREPNLRTIDVGCGNGYFTSQAARRGGTALGISFDPAQIQRCNDFKPYMPIVPEKVEFRVADARSLYEISERFDQMLLLEVIEHIDNDAEVLKKLAGLLKPGGVLHLTTPVSRFGPWCGFLDRFAQGGHCRLGYSEQRLVEIIRGAGLDVAYQSRLAGFGMFLRPLQVWSSERLGGGMTAQGIVFLLIYPVYFLLEMIPAPYSLRMVQHLIARKPMSEP